MRFTSRDLSQGVGSALRAEVQFCRDECAGLLKGLPVPKKAATEAPWVLAIALLSLAKSAAVVFSTAAESAMKPLAVPIWILEHSAKGVDEIYEFSNKSEQASLELVADKVRSQISQKILAAERSFYGTPVGSALSERLQSLIADRRSASLLAERAERHLWKVEGLARQIIAKSGIMITDYADIKASLRQTFEHAFNEVYSLYLASPLAGDFVRAKQNIFHTDARLTGEGDTVSFNRAYASLKELNSVGEVRHICRQRKQSFLSSGCASAFVGAQIKGREGFLYIMTNVDAFEVRVRTEGYAVAGGGVSGTALYKSVEVVPVVSDSQPVGFLSTKHLRTTLDALDQAYHGLLQRTP